LSLGYFGIERDFIASVNVKVCTRLFWSHDLTIKDERQILGIAFDLFCKGGVPSTESE
jgi:hypothetical protein